MPKQKPTDPYAPPPLHKSRMGPLIRGVIIVGLLAVGGAVAYTIMRSPAPETAAVDQQQAENQRLADGGYSVNSPQAAPPEAAPAPATAPAAAPRAVAPTRRAPRQSPPPVEDPTPVPEAPMATPAPATPPPVQPLPPDTSPGASGE